MTTHLSPPGPISFSYDPFPDRPKMPRDAWTRPKVMPPTGGPLVPYTRCTTFVGVVEDYYTLGRWQRRNAIRGVAESPDLVAAIRDLDAELDKKRLDELAEEAMERAGGGDAARWGSYMHAVCEEADAGRDPAAVPLPWQSTGEMDPEAYVPFLEDYQRVTAELHAVEVEVFLVQDPLKIGGTADRIVKWAGKRYIADIKTGNIEYGPLKIAAQLAVYARSRPYDWTTQTRLEAHGADIERGIVIHLDRDTGMWKLYWVDLMQGWEAVRACRDMRQLRQVRFHQLMHELRPVPDAPLTLADQIKLAPSREALEAIWSANAATWTDELTQLAKAHLAALAGTLPFPVPSTHDERPSG